VSALAFTILAVLLVGPAPALLARATWPLRAPRAAMVLWQAIALAAVLSAFSAGIAIDTRVLMPGPDGRPTASVVGAAGRLGWPLWTADRAGRRPFDHRRGPRGHCQSASAGPPPHGG